ncbi:hypothetical protein F4777DRAFT_261714 [Nemania sp. FL0916]|nr:hypothetical protein F4777DRAFT_261714 [Nemania sp. FL0916]
MKTRSSLNMHHTREINSRVSPTVPGSAELPKHGNSFKHQQGSQQNYRHRGKFSKHHRHHHSYVRRPGRCHNNKGSFQVRKTPWQSTEALELGLHPREFDELHAERGYLLNALESRDREALELFRRLPAVEEQICHYKDAQRRYRQRDRQNQGMNGKVKVRIDGVLIDREMDGAREEEEEEEWEEKLQDARRHRVWLRKQIETTVDAERGILARLCELHIEIQCRDRWCRVEQERAEGMLYTPEPECGGFDLGLTTYPKEPLWWQSPYQDSLRLPEPYIYQPDYYGYEHPGYGYQEPYDHAELLGARYREALESSGEYGVNNAGPPASYQVGETDKDKLKRTSNGGVGL